MALEPRATYRVQLKAGFGLDQAREIIDYLADLGISHLYTSPFLQAAAGSSHGYDVVDPSKINVELGDDPSYQLLCNALKAADLGLMIDIVPNHMAILGKQNPWWWDVLENGPSSPFATYFDIDWASSEERWPNKILLPVLSDHYGRILEDHQFQLAYLEGHFVLHYFDNSFPIDPSSLSEFLHGVAEKCDSEMLAFIAESHLRLPRPTVTSPRGVERRHRDKAVLLQILIKQCQDQPKVLEVIQEEIKRLNEDPDSLDRLIEKQNYRLSFWRTANKDLGYRRFFDIKELIGLRMEDDEVFKALHALPRKWFSQGDVHGVRIDHPDGLRNPKKYFARLKDAFPGAWVVAEKILKPGETLPYDWNVNGTTGYDFLHLLTNIYIHSEGEEELTQIYRDFTGQQMDFNEVVYECKRLVINELFGSEMGTLTRLLIDICEKHRRYRDYTRAELKGALSQIAACFPVYRTYVSSDENLVSSQDQRYVTSAITLAIAKNPHIDEKLFRFIEGLLLLEFPGDLESELAMRFQQFTGPAMAKGFEDTALYRYHRLIALNEVGGDPGVFGISLQQFHEACLAAQEQRPLSLLASTTHDTKRSEDVRARLTLLSEIPLEWAQAVKRWKNHNERHRLQDQPDRNTEYLLYQTLVGAWPLEEDRLLAYMEKAIREAKEHTSWTRQNKEYEDAIQRFIQAILADKTFTTNLENFVAHLVKPGRINGLSQTLIKLTAPGVPDIYQGSELWNMSLVDPDNRREVNFETRRDLLNQLKSLNTQGILDRMEEGLPKLWVIQQTLQLRKQHPDLFGSEGSYQPKIAKGNKSDHIVAFLRGNSVMTIVPRLLLKLNNDWEDTTLELSTGPWRNVLTHELINEDKIFIKELLKNFPVALLIREDKIDGRS